MRKCASLIARWSVDHPDSDLWRATLSTLRKKTQARSSSLMPARLETLRALYREGANPGGDAEPPRVEALRVTSLFLNHYNHVVPFDRRVLEEVWGRCGGEGCEAVRARTEELVWGLDGSASR